MTDQILMLFGVHLHMTLVSDEMQDTAITGTHPYPSGPGRQDYIILQVFFFVVVQDKLQSPVMLSVFYMN